jgi:hypothetical protein
MIKIIDDFLPPLYQTVLEKLLLIDDFPWLYQEQTCNVYETETSNYVYLDANTMDFSQFVHVFCNNGVIYSTVQDKIFPVLYFASLAVPEITGMVKAKANMTLPFNAPIGSYNTPHIDLSEENILTLIYYVNDSDGDTLLFEEKPEEFTGTLTVKQSVTPKKGRAVLFNSRTIHAGQLPRESKKRVLINFNFLMTPAGVQN